MPPESNPAAGLRAALRRRPARPAAGEPAAPAARAAVDPRLRPRRRALAAAAARLRTTRQKLDQYLTGVREIETRIEKAERFGDVPDPDVETPAGIPPDYAEYVQLMYDMLLLAFQTDSTRVATLLLAHDGSNRSFDHIGISEGHHDLSHHQNRPDWIEKVADIDLWYVQQFARFLEKLEATKDVDGNSLLHNSMIVYGSGNADGNRHTHDNLPILLAGGGGGTLTPGPLRQARLQADDQPVPQHGRPPGRPRPAAVRRLHRAAGQRLSNRTDIPERTRP